jgi:hypothetical protein
MIMRYQLFSQVALADDIPGHDLRQGDVATIIDYHPVTDGEDGYSLEIFNAVGDTIAVVVVPESTLAPLTPQEVLHVRVMTAAD